MLRAVMVVALAAWAVGGAVVVPVGRTVLVLVPAGRQAPEQTCVEHMLIRPRGGHHAAALCTTDCTEGLYLKTVAKSEGSRGHSYAALCRCQPKWGFGTPVATKAHAQQSLT